MYIVTKNKKKKLFLTFLWTEKITTDTVKKKVMIKNGNETRFRKEVKFKINISVQYARFSTRRQWLRTNQIESELITNVYFILFFLLHFKSINALLGIQRCVWARDAFRIQYIIISFIRQRNSQVERPEFRRRVNVFFATKIDRKVYRIKRIALISVYFNASTWYYVFSLFNTRG